VRPASTSSQSGASFDGVSIPNASDCLGPRTRTPAACRAARTPPPAQGTSPPSAPPDGHAGTQATSPTVNRAEVRRRAGRGLGRRRSRLIARVRGECRRGSESRPAGCSVAECCSVRRKRGSLRARSAGAGAGVRRRNSRAREVRHRSVGRRRCMLRGDRAGLEGCARTGGNVLAFPLVVVRPAPPDEPGGEQDVRDDHPHRTAEGEADQQPAPRPGRGKGPCPPRAT
jgi:hypothetical protein